MRGNSISSSKIKGKNPFAQKSRCKKEYPFLVDQNVDLDVSKSSSKSKDDHQEEPIGNGKVKCNGVRGEIKWPTPILRRNHSANSYRKKKGDSYTRTTLEMSPATGGKISSFSKSCSLERRSSSKSNIKGAIKRVFSLKLRRSSSSVSSHSEYIKILHDQDQDKSLKVDDCDYVDDNHDHSDDCYYDNRHQNHDDDEDDEFRRNDGDGSMEESFMSKEEDGSKSMSKVVKAYKRLFSR